MKQRCHLSMVWLTWLGLPALAVLIGWAQDWVGGVIVLGVGVIAHPIPARLPRVILYTADICPFCPIIRKRLEDLRRDAGFEFEEVDVSFRPHVVKAKKRNIGRACIVPEACCRRRVHDRLTMP